MKGKLHKMVSGYILSLNGDIDDPYAIVNEELAKDYEWHKLSIKNCQAIELGYNLDELANVFHEQHKFASSHIADITSFKQGFQKAIEILGDKKFSEEQMFKMFIYGHALTNAIKLKVVEDKPMGDIFNDFIQSLQQTEWEVDIEMEYVGECNGNNDERCFQDSPGHNCGCFERIPKLDVDGCLILKRI